MISETSETTTQRLLRAFEREEKAVRRATALNDVPQANRRLVKMWSALEALASDGPQGKDAVESLLRSPIAHVRLRAAAIAIRWDPEIAVPVLGRLLSEVLDPQSSPDERIEVRMSANELLFGFFRVKPDRNNLIVPLKRYGVELPYRDHEFWQNREIPTSPDPKSL